MVALRVKTQWHFTKPNISDLIAWNVIFNTRKNKRLSHPFPRPLLMFTSFSMPPLSAKALAFSMLRLVTSCSVQQTDATVSSDSTDGLPPGSRFTRSRMAYFPGGGDAETFRLRHPSCYSFKPLSLCQAFSLLYAPNKTNGFISFTTLTVSKF